MVVEVTGVLSAVFAAIFMLLSDKLYCIVNVKNDPDLSQLFFVFLTRDERDLNYEWFFNNNTFPDV